MSSREERLRRNDERYAEQARSAEIESVFRAGNEAIRRSFAIPPDQEFSFLCECSDPNCLDAIELTLDEYRSVRSGPARFAVRNGHQVAEVENVVQETDDYTVVEKRDVGRAVAEANSRR